MAETDVTFPDFLDRVIDFPEEGGAGTTSYELLQTIAPYRTCHDGTPFEARLVFTCRKASKDSIQRFGDEFIMKIKVQVPKYPEQEPEKGPSTTTAAEVEALKKFKAANNPSTPHFVTWKRATQSEKGPFPGGYITYVVMTKVPGDSLYDLVFEQMPKDEREDIVKKLLVVLRSIHVLGIEPIDRGLRNILWDQASGKCSVIDFELWRETSKDTMKDESIEMYRWGVGKLPPGLDFFTLFHLQQR